MPAPNYNLLGRTVLSALGKTLAITVARAQPGGAYDQATGVWSGPTPATLTMDAFVEHASPEDLMQLPEEERTKETIAVFTTTPLQTSDVAQQLTADVVTWRGRQWQVCQVSNNSLFLGVSRVLAQRVGV